MFHIKYPRFRGFFAWDELGCLARSLGFPVDLFKDHVGISEEILVEENGLPHKELERLLDHKILFKAIHLTQNLHTADWNTCSIRRCASILDHHALTYENIYNARVAYEAYEASDMKGMVIDRRILLRTLKMCGKTISPKKLMHRVKHSRDEYDEPGRMQLYEFIDLILWAHGYQKYIPDETYGHFEMDDELFKLTDFDRLLSHHDERLATMLDAQYLKEEWEFPETKLSSKAKFKDNTVVCGDKREATTQNQKSLYRYLKSDVGQSQKTVYYTQNGLFRERPLTAPNVGQYRSHNEEEYKRKQSLMAQTASYNKFKRLIQRTLDKDKSPGIVGVDMSDKPVLTEHKRCNTPLIVTETDLEETDKNWEKLMFDIETEEGRYEIAMDTEMEHYIPDYKDNLDKKKTQAPEPQLTKKSRSPDRRSNYSVNTAHSLAYPTPRLPPAHARKCDARFRGWYPIRSKKGQHYVLVSPFLKDSPKGTMFQKMAKMSNEEVKRVHGDYIFRKTRTSEVDRRPVTAPAVLTMAEYRQVQSRLELNSPQKHSRISSGYGSMEDNANHDETQTPNLKGVPENDEYEEEAHSRKSEMDKENIDTSKAELQQEADELEHDRDNESPDTNAEYDINGSRESVETSISDRLRLMGNSKQKLNVDNRQRAKSAYTHRYEELQSSGDRMHVQHGDVARRPSSMSAMDYHQLHAPSLEEIAPIPYMDHSKPKIVSVGSIGKISLLENISEAKYWEDLGLKKNELLRQKVEDMSLSSGDEDNGEDESAKGKDTTSQKLNKKVDEVEDDDQDILDFIAMQEKLRKKRNKSAKSSARSNKSSNSLSSSKKSPRSHHSSRSVTGSEQKSGSRIDSEHSRYRQKSGKQSNEENIKNKKYTSETVVTNYSSSDNLKPNTEDSENVDKTSKQKHVNICINDRSKKKPVVNKYERLVSRMGEDISQRLSKRLLTATLDTRK